MQIGKLRKRLAVQTPAATAANEFNEVVPAWTTLATVWGHVEPLAGRELFQAQQVFADVTHRVTLRYVASLLPPNGLTSKMRLVLNGRNLNIGAVLNLDERNRTYTVLCQEFASQ